MNSYCKECEICFENIFIKGKLNCCAHNFHYSCIYRWSKLSTHCPTCRKTYSDIYKEIGGKIVKVISMNDSKNDPVLDQEDWQVVCFVCSSASQTSLITCKGSFACPIAVHTYCLGFDVDPTLWMCSTCTSEFSEFSFDSDSSEDSWQHEELLDNDSNSSEVMCWEPEAGLNDSAVQTVQRVQSTQNTLAGSFQSNLPTNNSTPSVIDVDEQAKDVIFLDFDAENHRNRFEQLRSSDFQQFGQFRTEKLFTISEYFVEDLHGEFVKQQVINFDLPCKRPARGGLTENFVKQIQREKPENRLDNSISQNFLQFVTLRDSGRTNETIRCSMQNTRD